MICIGWVNLKTVDQGKAVKPVIDSKCGAKICLKLARTESGAEKRPSGIGRYTSFDL
jgi:hypothetical protein